MHREPDHLDEDVDGPCCSKGDRSDVAASRESHRAFASILLGAVPVGSVPDGRLQHAALGVRVDALGDGGRPMPPGEAGELAVLQPLPSMPTGLLGDEDGHVLAAHYLERFAGPWCHGDLVEFAADGSAAILGRSDGTLKRNGVRLGAADYYEEVLGWPEAADALVVDVTSSSGHEIVLFVEMVAGVELDADLARRFRERIRTHLSPRHTPDKVVALPRVPRNENGKRLEVPVRNLLAGRPGSLAEQPDVEPATLAVLQGFAGDAPSVVAF